MLLEHKDDQIQPVVETIQIDYKHDQDYKDYFLNQFQKLNKHDKKFFRLYPIIFFQIIKMLFQVSYLKDRTNLIQI